MVLLSQGTQNKGSLAGQLKLNEMVADSNVRQSHSVDEAQARHRAKARHRRPKSD
jgi:hypothetical protein